MKALALIVTALGLVSASAVLADGGLREGKWEVTTQMQMPGVPMQLPATTRRVYEFARKGIRVNVVAPGHTASETAISHISPEQRQAMAESLVPGRFMTPEESANAIVWLCSDAASGVNGAIINVNGEDHRRLRNLVNPALAPAR